VLLELQVREEILVFLDRKAHRVPVVSQGCVERMDSQELLDHEVLMDSLGLTAVLEVLVTLETLALLVLLVYVVLLERQA